jgi:hypothetical protein
MARLTRDPEIPMTLPDGWRTLLRAMTTRAPQQRPEATHVADALRRLGEGLDPDATMAVAAPAPATSVLSSTQALPRTAARPAPVRRSRGPLVAALALVLALAAAIAVGVAVARHSNGNGTTTFTPGQPRLPAPLEVKMEQLERLVQR